MYADSFSLHQCRRGELASTFSSTFSVLYPCFQKSVLIIAGFLSRRLRNICRVLVIAVLAHCCCVQDLCEIINSAAFKWHSSMEIAQMCKYVLQIPLKWCAVGKSYNKRGKIMFLCLQKYLEIIFLKDVSWGWQLLVLMPFMILPPQLKCSFWVFHGKLHWEVFFPKLNTYKLFFFLPFSLDKTHRSQVICDSSGWKN